MLPERWRELLMFQMAEAMALAGKGQFLSGYEILLAGRNCAEAIRLGGEPWGELLLQRYDEALRRYEERWSQPPVAASCL